MLWDFSFLISCFKFPWVHVFCSFFTAFCSSFMDMLSAISEDNHGWLCLHFYSPCVISVTSDLHCSVRLASTVLQAYFRQFLFFKIIGSGVIDLRPIVAFTGWAVETSHLIIFMSLPLGLSYILRNTLLIPCLVGKSLATSILEAKAQKRTESSQH